MSATTKQKKLVPELRFSGFDGEWSSKKLEDIAEYKNGGAFENNLVVGGKYNLITLNSIDIKGNLKAEHKTVSYADWYLQKNDLVMVLSDVAHGNFLGLVDVIPVDNKYVLNQRMGLLRKVDTAINLRFLRLNINLNQQYFKLHGQGSSQQNLSKGDILKFKVVAPTSKEQQKIADFLGSVDAWLDNLHGQKTALQSYKQGMMQKLFTGQVRFKDEAGKSFPDWEEKELGDIFSAVKGAGISKEQLDANGENQCILYGELYTVYSEQVFEVRSKTFVSSGTRSKVGDLLVPCSTTTTAIDLANVTALNKENVLLGGDITALRSKTEVDSVFYAYYLSNHKKRDLAKYGQGVTIIHVYYSHFKDMHIDVPSLPEQQKIADFLTALDQTITAKADEITKVEEWKKGLMQKMFV